MSYFPSISAPIRYEGRESTNPLAFRHYQPNELFDGRPMREHLRFSVAYWHTFCGAGADPFGAPTFRRPWDDEGDALSVALRRIDVAFEFFTKLGVPFWCFHDRDIAPEGATLRESNQVLDRVVAHAKAQQEATGVRLLWGTANLFSHPRYLAGAATNPDAAIFAYAAAQVKKALEVTKELGGENYVFWGGREGYDTLLNTNLRREQDHLAAFFQMAVDYAREIGFTGQFLIEPKPKEPTKHQYDFDVATSLAFLRSYGLAEHFKFNIETNHATLAGHSFQHEIEVAAAAGMLGSIDANTGDALLGWDTDQFNTDPRELTLAMLSILRAGGLGSGGLNFDAKLRRASIEPDDLFHAHIGGMDAYAFAFRTARRILADGVFEQFVAERYASFDRDFGSAIEQRNIGLADLEAIALNGGEPQPVSGRQEMLENLLLRYLA